MRGACLIFMLFACKSEPILNLSQQQRMEFCAPYPYAQRFLTCTPMTLDPPHCDYSTRIDCTELLNTLPPTCEATAEDVARCLDATTCDEAAECEPICGVKVWSHYCCACL